MSTDLNKLPPAALKAAMQTGTSSWGRYGSASEHALYIVEYQKPLPRKGRRKCRCGCKRYKTHYVAANGVCLASGCELEARRSLKKLQEYRGKP